MNKYVKCSLENKPVQPENINNCEMSRSQWSSRLDKEIAPFNLYGERQMETYRCDRPLNVVVILSLVTKIFKYHRVSLIVRLLIASVRYCNKSDDIRPQKDTFPALRISIIAMHRLCWS